MAVVFFNQESAKKKLQLCLSELQHQHRLLSDLLCNASSLNPQTVEETTKEVINSATKSNHALHSLHGDAAIVCYRNPVDYDKKPYNFARLPNGLNQALLRGVVEIVVGSSEER
jgi:predicted solute-binding protein